MTMPIQTQDKTQYQPPVKPYQSTPVQPPSPPPPPVPPVNDFVYEKPKSSKKPILKIFLVIAGVIILSAVAVFGCLASRVWDPMWNPFRPAPEKVLSTAMENMQNIKTFHLKADLVSANPESEFSLKTDNDIDISNLKNLKIDSDIKATVNFFGASFEVDGEVKFLDRVLYAKIEDIPLLGSFLQSFESDSKKVFGQWIKFDTKTSSWKLNSTSLNYLKRFYTDSSLYSVVKQDKDEKIGDVNAYHYVVSINKDKFKKITSDFLKSAKPEEGLNIASFSADIDIEQLMSDQLSGLDETDIEIWIGKKDNRIYKLTIENKEEKTSGSFEFSNYDAAQKITAPANATDIEKVSSTRDNGNTEVKANTEKTKIEEKMKSLKTQVDAVFDAKLSYTAANCKNTVISPICAEIKKMSPTWYFKVASKTYYAYAVLGNEYYCIDDIGFSGWTKTNPKAKGYCN